MSVTIGALDRTHTSGAVLAGASATACYTNNGSFASKGVDVSVANESGGTVTVKIEWYDSSAGASFTRYVGSLADDVTLLHDLKWMRLDTSDEIRVTGAAGVSVIVTVLETQGRGQ